MNTNGIYYSEIALVVVNDTDFSEGVWVIGELYKQYAIDIFVKTFANLYQAGSIGIVSTLERVHFLRIPLWTERKFIVSLLNDELVGKHNGWLEKLIFDQLSSQHSLDFGSVTINILELLLGTRKTYSNPAKAFIIAGLERQQYGFFSYGRYHKFLTTRVEVWQTPEQQQAMDGLFQVFSGSIFYDFSMEELGEVVKESLSRFTND